MFIVYNMIFTFLIYSVFWDVIIKLETIERHIEILQILLIPFLFSKNYHLLLNILYIINISICICVNNYLLLLIEINIK